MIIRRCSSSRGPWNCSTACAAWADNEWMNEWCSLPESRHVTLKRNLPYLAGTSVTSQNKISFWISKLGSYEPVCLDLSHNFPTCGVDSKYNYLVGLLKGFNGLMQMCLASPVALELARKGRYDLAKVRFSLKISSYSCTNEDNNIYCTGRYVNL